MKSGKDVDRNGRLTSGSEPKVSKQLKWWEMQPEDKRIR